MKALITGAYGFAGRYLVKHLLEEGDQVIATSLFKETEQIGTQYAQLDVTDLTQCTKRLAEFTPDAVFHLAGMAFAPDAERDFRQALVQNVEGTYNIFKAAKELNREIVVVTISSAEVYGRITAQDLPLTEQTPTRPAHNYSLSKLMAEEAVKRFESENKMRCVVIRAFNHIGPGQRVDFVVSNFAFQLSEIKKGKSAAVMKVGNLDAKRDFSDVRDTVRAYRLAAEKGRGVYNIASGKSVSIQSILDQLIEISGLKVKIERDPARMRPAEVPEIYGSFEKAKQELGFEPKFRDLRASLEQVFNHWMQKN